jgi:hypothetical protein
MVFMPSFDQPKEVSGCYYLLRGAFEDRPLAARVGCKAGMKAKKMQTILVETAFFLLIAEN